MPLPSLAIHHLAGVCAAVHDGWDKVGCEQVLMPLRTDPRPAETLVRQVTVRMFEAKWTTPRGLLEPLTAEPATPAAVVSTPHREREACPVHDNDLRANNGEWLCCWQERAERGSAALKGTFPRRRGEHREYVPAAARELIEASIGPRAEARRQTESTTAAGAVRGQQEGGE